MTAMFLHVLFKMYPTYTLYMNISCILLRLIINPLKCHRSFIDTKFLIGFLTVPKRTQKLEDRGKKFKIEMANKGRKKQ